MLNQDKGSADLNPQELLDKRALMIRVTIAERKDISPETARRRTRLRGARTKAKQVERAENTAEAKDIKISGQTDPSGIDHIHFQPCPLKANGEIGTKK